MINRRKKLHQAENLVSWPYSSEFAVTTATHHTTMMYQIGGRNEATDLAWRLPQQRLGIWPSWSVGACSLANLPSKNTLQQHNCHIVDRPDRRYADCYSAAEYVVTSNSH
jgi:hypothetical protein